MMVTQSFCDPVPPRAHPRTEVGMVMLQKGKELAEDSRGMASADLVE